MSVGFVMFNWTYETQPQIESDFKSFVMSPSFPCVGAKAALGRSTLKVVACRDITSAWDDVRIHDLLVEWARSYKSQPGLFRSIAFVFEGPARLSEEEFESALWNRVQSLTSKDVWRGLPADSSVSSNPADDTFSLSFGGLGFFVVGMHPQASRPARRHQRPALVFNLHDQFEGLRANGQYEKLRAAIIGRDVAVAGSPNPMLARHGEVSEARQYSGRQVGEDWVCPFTGRHSSD